MAVTVEQFVKALSDSGLMTPDEVAAFRAALPDTFPRDVQHLAVEMVRQSKLTRYQATILYQGGVKGLVLGDYVVLEKIGAGGMGQVFKAQHRRMKRVVAIKLLPSSVTKDVNAIRRFQREVEAAARLSHPNIVSALDAREEQGVHYLVMEYVDGGDLAVYVKKHGKMPVDRAVDCVTQAARGLEHAHGERIVHRDIKPANLLLDKRGTLKVLDMGLARVEQPLAGISLGQGLTDSGYIMGTVDFMSPEQAEDTRSADNRADIYSLGCTLYYLLTGEKMYAGDTAMKKLMAHREAPIPALSSHRTDLPPGLQAVFEKMVAKRPERRYQSMAEVISALDECLARQTVELSPTAEMAGDSASDPGLASFLKSVSATSSGTKMSAVKAPATTADETLNKQADSPTLPPVVTPLRSPPAARQKAAAALQRQYVLIGLAAAAVVLVVAAIFSLGSLRTPQGQLILALDQPDLELFIDDQPRLLPSNTRQPVTLELTEGRHTIELARTGYQSFVQDVDIAADQPLSLRVHLTPLGAATPDRLAAEWVLQQGGRVTIAGPYRRETVAKIDELPGQAFHVLSVDLMHKLRIADDDLKRLANLKELHTLYLTGTHTSQTGLKHLAKLPNLRHLYISGTLVEDGGIAGLVNLPKLEYIECRRNPLTAERVAKFETAHPNCRINWDGAVSGGLRAGDPSPDRRVAQWVLALGGHVTVSIAGQPAEPIHDLGNLPDGDLQVRFVALQGVKKLSADGLWNLCGLSSLNSVGLDDTAITNQSLEPLLSLKELNSLFLWNTAVGDEGLALLKQIPKLAHLTLGKTRITDDGLAHLVDLPELTTLALNFTNVGQRGLQHLVEMPKLNSVNLDQTLVTATDYEKFVSQRPEVKVIWNPRAAAPPK